MDVSHSVSYNVDDLILDSQTKHFNPKWPEYFGLSCLIQEELKSINKRQPAFYNKIIQVSGVLFHGWYTPSTPIFEVINAPCDAIFKSQSTFSTKSKENKHSNINKYSFSKNKYHLKRTIQLKTAMAYESRSCDPFRPITVIQILISHVTLQGKQILTNRKWCNFIHPFLPV